MTHSPVIQQIDTVRAYYCGPRLIVEVDVVIDKSESVEVAHDTAEGLQIKLEKLPSVERAYVHIDYETTHSPVSLSHECHIWPCLGNFTNVDVIGTRVQEVELRASSASSHGYPPIWKDSFWRYFDMMDSIEAGS